MAQQQCYRGPEERERMFVAFFNPLWSLQKIKPGKTGEQMLVNKEILVFKSSLRPDGTNVCFDMFVFPTLDSIKTIWDGCINLTLVCISFLCGTGYS